MRWWLKFTKETHEHHGCPKITSKTMCCERQRHCG